MRSQLAGLLTRVSVHVNHTSDLQRQIALEDEKAAIASSPAAPSLAVDDGATKTTESKKAKRKREKKARPSDSEIAAIRERRKRKKELSSQLTEVRGAFWGSLSQLEWEYVTRNSTALGVSAGANGAY